MNEDLTLEELKMAFKIEMESFDLIDEKVSQEFREKRNSKRPKNVKMCPRLKPINRRNQNVPVSRSTSA